MKIETVLNILKEDHNFREILQDGEYLYSASGVSFNQISYDSRKVNAETLFFVKGANFKNPRIKAKLWSAWSRVLYLATCLATATGTPAVEIKRNQA